MMLISYKEISDNGCKFLTNIQIEIQKLNIEYSYQLFTKCFVENYENSKFFIFLIFKLNLHKIFTVLLDIFFTFSIELI